MRPQIAYADGYHYQLREEYSIHLDFLPGVEAKTDWLELKKDGLLTIRRGYAWDGPSGPVSGPEILRGSLVHDALYQLMRLGLLSRDAREGVDDMLRRLCLQDGMHRLEAWIVYHAVRLFGGGSAEAESERPTKYAPEKTT